MTPSFFSFLLTLVLSLSFLSMNSISEETSTVEIKITNIRNAKGNFVLGFYKDNASFAKRTPYMNKSISKANLKDAVVTYKLSMPYGTHGIALLDDENDNKKVDYGFILPVEGFGFSDYYHKGLTAPSFEDFDFKVASATQTVVIKVKYM